MCGTVLGGVLKGKPKLTIMKTDDLLDLVFAL